MKYILIVLLFLPSLCWGATTEKIMVQVRFVVDTPHGQYSDCLYFSQDDYAKLSKKDLAKKEGERVSNWLDLINNPAPIVEPSLEQEQSILQGLIEQKQSIEAQIIEKQDKISLLQAKPIGDVK